MNKTLGIYAGILFFLFSLCCFTGMAATKTWDTTAGSWFTTGNWSPAGVPGITDNVVIANADANISLTNAVTNASMTLAGLLVFSNWDTSLNVTSNVTIQSGGRMSCSGPFTNDGVSNRVYIICSNLTLESGGSINVETNGYAGGPNTNGYGPGGGLYDYASQASRGCGASYGGWGGGWQYKTSFRPAPYGLPDTPLSPGSGGGGFTNVGVSAKGGDGGGAVRIQASGAVTVNGTITANGGNGVSSSTNGGGGGGSGGGIYITCYTFGGNGGIIQADGGLGAAASSGNGAQGAGGRIAIIYNTNAQPAGAVSVQFSAVSRFGWEINGYADAGTIYLPDTKLLPETLTPNDFNGQLWGIKAWSPNNLTVSNCWVRLAEDGVRLSVSNDLTVMGTGGMFEVGGSLRNEPMRIPPFSSTSCIFLTVGGNLIVTNSGELHIYASATNAVSPDYGARVTVTGTVFIASNSWIYPYSHPTNGGSVFFQVGNLQIDRYGGINADYRGWADIDNDAGVRWGEGPGGGYKRGGGAYGGNGGYGHLTNDYIGGSPYGSALAPKLPGSASGIACDWCGFRASTPWRHDGGGLVWVEANDTITVHGTITANGTASVYFYGDAGSSGGGIYLVCRTFVGSTNAILRANGGNGGSHATEASGGGSGGRIAVYRIYDINGQGAVSNAVSAGAYGSGILPEDGTIVWMGPPITMIKVY